MTTKKYLFFQFLSNFFFQKKLHFSVTSIENTKSSRLNQCRISSWGRCTKNWISSKKYLFLQFLTNFFFQKNLHFCVTSIENTKSFRLNQCRISSWGHCTKNWIWNWKYLFLQFLTNFFFQKKLHFSPSSKNLLLNQESSLENIDTNKTIPSSSSRVLSIPIFLFPTRCSVAFTICNRITGGDLSRWFPSVLFIGIRCAVNPRAASF